MKTALLILTLFGFFFSLSKNVAAQPLPLTYQDYNWEESPKLHTLTADEAEKNEIILKEKRAYEYVYENDQLVQYVLNHKIIRLNSDEAIEENNKVYIPLSGGDKMVKQKARVITKDGKVKVLDNRSIKEAVDEDNDRSYRYYALEGIEKGSEIEYFFLRKMQPDYLGTIVTLQSEVPAKDVEFDIITPSNLIFATKSYNGLPEFQKDSTVTDKNILRMKSDYIPELKDERFAAYSSNLQKLIFKLDQNTYNGKKGIVSFAEASKLIYASVYPELSNKEKKAVAKLVKKMEIDEGASEREKARVAEDYLKQHYHVVSAPNLSSDLNAIIKMKVSTRNGAVKLFAAVLKQLDIDHELVLTSNRFSQRFDPDFEAYTFLDEYLFYFPSFDDYMAPTSFLTRLGCVPYQWRNNYGLFVRPVSLGEFQTGMGKVKFIQPTDYENNFSNIDLKVDFEKENLQTLNMKLKQEWGGQYAQGYQPVYGLLEDKEREEIAKELIKYLSEDMEIDDYNVENSAIEDFGIKPFVINSTMTSNAFVERAGDKYLFKVGELIGPQSELYTDEERTLEVENTYNRKYHRVITFTIPDGYDIKNLDALNMDIFHEENGDRTAAFTSTFTRNGNEVQVVIDEYYKKIIYPIEQYEAYRKVINAAADFNKVVLFLEKKV